MNQYVYDATQQKWFVNEWERRMSELEKMRLIGKFGKRTSIPSGNAKQCLTNLSARGSTKKEAISTRSKRFSSNSTRLTRRQRHGR